VLFHGLRAISPAEEIQPSLSCNAFAKNDICPRLQSRADVHSQARHAQTQQIAQGARADFPKKAESRATATVSNAGTHVKEKRLISRIIAGFSVILEKIDGSGSPAIYVILNVRRIL